MGYCWIETAKDRGPTALEAPAATVAPIAMRDRTRGAFSDGDIEDHPHEHEGEEIPPG